MAYRNKTYICFDADIDMHYYNCLKMWNAHDKFEIAFYNAHEINNIWTQSKEETIKRRLRERMANTKLLVVLIGEKTKNLFKYVRWEIDLALKLDVPIIAINLNKVNGIDNDRCPAILRAKPVLHIPFKPKAIEHAFKNWVQYYLTAKREGMINLYYEWFKDLD
ncbi:hypothetical protein B1R38_27025 [Bacillus cereus]|uniref:TIR domain-containing protein n=1 Tax=Bacillus cereus TaxID=1396 RepID=UPI000D65B0FF|nr:TIR domain-containing protein [Bacillus cereus]PWE70242.1 hypothetical protein B1R38_27025 [Bacillus cereus]